MGIGRQSLLPADSGCMHPTRTALEAAEGARVGVQLGDPRRNGLFSCTNPDVPLQLAEDRGWCVLGGGFFYRTLGTHALSGTGSRLLAAATPPVT